MKIDDYIKCDFGLIVSQTHLHNSINTTFILNHNQFNRNSLESTMLSITNDQLLTKPSFKKKILTSAIRFTGFTTYFIVSKFFGSGKIVQQTIYRC
jgi:hypothetical protein